MTGGLDLAAEWAGFTTVGQCEWADYPTKVLEKHWPDVPRWRDIRSVTNESIREKGIKDITILSGGFPCQPHSVAGERKASADERDLWGEFVRVICETKPKWILGENVSGLLTSEDGWFFGRVLRDLAGLGYHVGWSVYGAEKVGAFHKRDRVFIVANSECGRLQIISKEPSNNRFPASTSLEHDCFKGILQSDNRVWPSESEFRRVVNGVPNWMDRLKCLGNAVVPQQAYPIFQAIADIENMEANQ